MDTYFERLEEIIKRHEQEIDHLNAERMALRREENNMSFDAFNREYQRIINYLENESRSLNEAQNTLENYHFHYDKAQKLIIDLRNLQKDKELARDIHDENEIKEEIAAKEKELQESMRILPLELADYLRSSILEEEKAIEEEPISENKTSEEQTTFETQNSTTENFQLNVTEQEKEEQSQEANNNSEPSNSSENSSTNNTTIIEQTGIHTTLSNEALLAYEDLSQQIENLKNEQLTNNRLLEETVNRIQEIIKEQRERYEKEGPFDTDTLTRLDEYYMGLKISENEVFVELQRNETRLARKLKSLEKKQQEIANIDDISIAFGISYEESEELFKTLKNRKVITEIFEKKGLGNLIHKSSRTKAEKELLKQTLEEIRKEIITHRKTNKDINIKDTINILYGMDTKVRKN